MDKLSKNTINNLKNYPEKISLTFSKDKEQWSISKPEALVEKSKTKKSNPETKKSAPITKINCKVSIPLSRVPNCWKRFIQIIMTHKMPPYVRITRLRPPPAPIQPMRPPPVSTPNATKLRSYRHPVPTNTCRTITAEKFDKEITETITNNVECMPYRREVDLDSAKQKLPVCGASANIRTELSNHLNNSATNLTISTATASIQTEKTFVIEEEDFNVLQVIRKKNISEQELHILEVIHNSGVKQDELLRQLEKIKKRKESSNNSDDVVIDVEKYFKNTRENNLNLEKLMRLSEQNKNVLVNRFIALARLAAASQQPLPQPGTSTLETVTPHEISPMQLAQTNSTSGTHPSAVTRDQIITTSEARTPTALETLSEVACAEMRRDATATKPVRITVISNEVLRSPIAEIPTEDSSAFASLAPTTIEVTYRNNGPCNDLLSQTAKTPTAFQTSSPADSFARAYPERVENIMAFQKSRARPNTDDTWSSNSNICTQDKSNSKKRKATPDHHTDNITTRYDQINLPLPQTGTARPTVQELQQNEAVVQKPQQQQQDSSMFQQIPVHVRKPQIPGRHDRSELHIERARKLQQQRALYQRMRIQYEQSRPTILNAPHIAPQQPQMPPVQLYPSEQIRLPLPSQMPIAPARRVFSTEEANIHGQAVQRGRNWHYPVFYDRNGNCWPRPHDFSQ